ncbi:N-acetylmuramoyl-L-alanine amidase [Filobacillus milosensis]|nr:N-acetylmuramoyl-L-alanine amidase [Filobacillus milosensis]
MKKALLFVTLVLTLVIFTGGQVLADESQQWINFGHKNNVAIDKEWTITFNEKMDRSTLHSNSVYAVNENGEKLFLATYLNEERTKLRVLPPADLYNPGEDYTLYIESDVKSAEGYNMRNGYKMTFSIDPTAEKPYTLPNNPKADFFGTVTADTLNVRSGKSTDTEVIGQVFKGQELPIYDTDGFWVETEFEGQTAYLHKDYLKLRHVSGKLLEGLNIVVDAGHGDWDPGAAVNGAEEKDIVLSVTKNVRDRLERLGANVILTRNNDYFLSLEERVALSRSVYNDLFVSIHANSFSDPSVDGSEVFYSDSKYGNVDEGRFLAMELQQELVQMAEMDDRGVRDADFWVIYKNGSPAALVELGFMTSPSDLEKLLNSNHRYLYADSITQGIIEYFER